MKKILCYGDSNTFGYNIKDNSRFDENTRWTSLLQKNLGTEYEVLNEGVCDRTGFVNNPKGILYSAQEHFPKFISESEKFYLLILWLGTNDLQFQYDINADTVENGLKKLIHLAQTKVKNIIIIPPVDLNKEVLDGFFKFQFNETSIEKSKQMENIYKTIANINHCEYFNINKYTRPSKIDGIHYDENSHKIIAENLIKFII